MIDVARRRPVTSNGVNRATNISGANAMIPASTALSSTGISRMSPWTRSGCMSATSSETFAPSDVPPMTALSAPTTSSRSMTWRAKSDIEYSFGSVGRSDVPWPSRSTVITWLPASASARASGSCIRRGMSWPWISTTHRSPEPNSVYSRRWPSWKKSP